MAEIGVVRRATVRIAASLGLLLFGFLLLMVANDALRHLGHTGPLVAPGSPEAAYGAAHPGELVHGMATLVAAVLGGVGLAALVWRPGHRGAALHTAALAVALLAAGLLAGNPDNHGGQAGMVDPMFVILAVFPLLAAVLAAPWRASAGPRPPARLLALLALWPAALPYAVRQGLIQRDTWPPAADPHHQAHWFAVALLVLLTGAVLTAAVLGRSRWYPALLLTAVAAVLLGATSLMQPDAASALPPVGAVASLAWGAALAHSASRDG